MNPSGINQAIARACGVEPVLECWLAQKGDSSCFEATTRWEVEKWLEDLPEGSWAKEYKPALCYRYPDYHGDLNAIAQAERTLTDAEYERFAIALAEQMPETHEGMAYQRNMLSASAEQRAIAVVKCKGLWKPHPEPQDAP